MCDVIKERKKEKKEGKNFSPEFLLVWCGVVWGQGGAGQDKIFHH